MPGLVQAERRPISWARRWIPGLAGGALFVILTFWFQHHYHYYGPAAVELKGQLSGDRAVNVAWDTGAGFNQAESVTRSVNDAPADFELHVPLPQLRVLAVRVVPTCPDAKLDLSAARLVGDSAPRLLDARPDAETNAWELRIPPGVTVRFSVALLGVQLVTAALLSAVGAWLVGRWVDSPDRSIAGVLYRVFVADGRAAYWVLFALHLGVLTVYLAAYWPARMPGDPFYSWAEAKTLRIDNWHPFIYTFVLLMTMQIADSPAVLAVLQALLMAGMSAFVFWLAWRRGVRLRFLAPFLALMYLSIPLHEMTIEVSKDALFALLICLWGVLLAYAGYRRRVGPPLALSGACQVVLVLLLLVLALVRHNGLVYLAIVPLLALLYRLAPWRRIAVLTGLTLGAFVGLEFGIASLLHIHQNTNYRELGLQWQINPVAALLRVPHYGKLEKDNAVVAAVLDPQIMMEGYSPYSGVPLIYHPQRRTPSEAEAGAFARLLLRRAVENPHIFLADRAFMFSAALCSYNRVFCDSVLIDDEHTRVWTGAFLEVRALRHRPWSRSLCDAFHQASAVSRSDIRLQMTMWNGLPAVALLCALLLLHRRFPVAALFALCVLSQAPFLFITMPSGDFRYVYFLYMAGALAVPLALLDARLVPLRPAFPQRLLQREGVVGCCQPSAHQA